MCIRECAAVTLHFRRMITTVFLLMAKIFGPIRKCIKLYFTGSVADWNEDS